MKMKKVTIIGAGFMGGSLALALKKKRLASQVWAVARNKKRKEQIRRLKVFDRVTCDWASALADCDCVVLATPVALIIEHIKRIAPCLEAKTIVTDMGSTKSQIVKAARLHLPESFVGSHPLCGSEKKGATFADAGLFKAACCIVTPLKRNMAFRKVVWLWKGLGSDVVILKADAHDRALAYVSGLPHLVSFALTQTLPASFSKFAAGSLKDLTRISASSGKLWADIFLSNVRSLDKATAAFLKNIISLRSTIAKKKKRKLLSSLATINRKQKRLVK
ncbi:prephenate dehydrogenase [Candidatus Omnitrophota bacterium]